MKTIFAFLFLICTTYYCIGQLHNGYTDKLSYRAGNGENIVTFFLSGGNLVSQLPLIASDGTVTSEFITGLESMQGQSPQSNAWVNGFGYSSTTTWSVPSSLKSGLYFLPALTADGAVPVIIKNANYPSTADIVVVLPTNTYYAYNSNGGKSLYVPQGNAATTISFLRPDQRTDNGHYDDGFLRWIITSGMTNNYNISFISDMDMDDYNEIANAKLLIVPGHSEYWSRQARLNFDKFIDAGKDAMILSGNSFWWQVRYEDENFNADNTKLTCYRDVTLDNMNNTDPLLVTINWNEPTLKYSILGNIGADWLHGGYGVDVCGGACSIPCYGGFNGHKIVLPQSPLLNGLDFNLHDLLPFATGEYDGTLVKTDMNGNAVDINGNIILDPYNTDPVLDVSSLGFFRAELIGYDINTTNFNDPNPNNNNVKYCPFTVFQRTCTSGTIINVSSNEWCTNWVIGYNETGEINHFGNPNCGSSSTLVPDSRIPQITANMINLMMQDQNNNTIGINNGDNLFFNPRASGSFSMKPTYTNVSYNACSTGSIDMTPCGVYITDGYKVDRGFTYNYGVIADLNNNSALADIDLACVNYNNGLRKVNPTNNTNSKNNSLYQNSIFLSASTDSLQRNFRNQKADIFPNPNNGKFIVQFKNENDDNETKIISVYNSIGKIIYNTSTTNLQSLIDLSSQAKGIYFIKIQRADNIYLDKVIIQ